VRLLLDKNALIYGAGGAIGGAVARAFAHEGVRSSLRGDPGPVARPGCRAGPAGVRLICLRSAGSPDTPDVQETFRRHAMAAGVMLERFLADAGSAALLRRLPMMAEVANAAAMLASDWASAMTGTFVNVTCGSRAD
jgi:NAD(P)-dependent dehydrogenase (short-subunit alcohol dehydrogenase family)